MQRVEIAQARITLTIWATVALLSLSVVLLSLSTSKANDLAAPQGSVVLSISGEITRTNSGDSADFDLDMLMSFPARTIATSTNWTDGVVEFTGVSVKDLLNSVGVKRGILRLRALNDYAIDVSYDDIAMYDPIMAYHRDGNRMSVRQRGPLWIMYDFDAVNEEQRETLASYSVWQLRTIDVRRE